MIRITKPTVHQLNLAMGKLDVDTGQVFGSFVGRLHMDDRLYHGELRYTDVGDEPPEEEVSIRSILSSDEATGTSFTSVEVPILSPDEPVGEFPTSEEG